jgi:hypothetical protein
MNNQFTEHFSLAELTVTETGIQNIPDAIHVARLELLAIFMEKVRRILGNYPITVDSAFRSPAVNAAVGGVPDSAHEQAYACDFVCPAFGTPYQIALALSEAEKKGLIKFDQLIQEHTWVHISRDQRLRGQRLTLTGPGQYEDGINP